MNQFLNEKKLSSLQHSNTGLHSDINNHSLEQMHMQIKECSETSRPRPISVNTKRIEFIKLTRPGSGCKSSNCDQKLGSTQQINIVTGPTVHGARQERKRPSTSQGAYNHPKR